MMFILSLVLAFIASFLTNLTNLPILYLLILSTASWAAWDSTQIKLREYNSGIALHPVGLWIGIAMLWLIGFPWYLTVRYRIKKGTQERKASAPPASPPA
ncbi:MAG: hypothetical protein HY077_02855 [Elusimicrobia bacterium]|nr:hypothetical protein [Elusimicrobiota bacterium]